MEGGSARVTFLLLKLLMTSLQGMPESRGEASDCMLSLCSNLTK